MLVAGAHLTETSSYYDLYIYPSLSCTWKNFSNYSVRSFALIIVNYFTVIHFGYYRMRCICTKLPKNSYKYIFKIKEYYWIVLCRKCYIFKNKHVICNLCFTATLETRYKYTKNWLNKFKCVLTIISIATKMYLGSFSRCLPNYNHLICTLLWETLTWEKFGALNDFQWISTKVETTVALNYV